MCILPSFEIDGITKSLKIRATIVKMFAFLKKKAKCKTFPKSIYMWKLVKNCHKKIGGHFGYFCHLEK
jgi:hypothetical protein